MREGIHPNYYPNAVVTCACGNTWTTGSTIPQIRTDVCSSCHPFYTGEQRIVDTEGQVDRFMKRLQARQQIATRTETQEQARVNTNQTLTALGLSARNAKALEEAGIVTAGDLITRLEDGGDDAVLAIKGFGHKGLIDLKRLLRNQGFALPSTSADGEAVEAEA